jgi:hypothetical protein
MQQLPDRFRLVDHFDDGPTWPAFVVCLDVERRVERPFDFSFNAVCRAWCP